MKSEKTNKKTKVVKRTAEKIVPAKKTKDAQVPKEYTIKIYNSKGKALEDLKLNKKLFTGEVNKDVLYQAVRMYNANQRQGNAATKTRGDVSGGGKKPWRQKGTGRARAGSTRSPLWRGGGVIFGPHPRDFHYSIPDKVRKMAFVSSLNSKIVENRLIGIDSIALDTPKTKNFKMIMDALKLEGKSLFVLDAIDDNIKKASRNLKGVLVRNYKDVSTMDVLKSDNLVISKAAIEKMSERVKI